MNIKKDMSQNNINFNIKPDNFYIYSRVSTSKQYNDANGLDYQDMVSENYIKEVFKMKLEDVNYYCDIGSSYHSIEKLHDLNLMVKNIEKNSVIVTSEISRLGRNVHQVFTLLRKLKNKNCWIISVSEGLCLNKSKLMDKQFYQKIIDAERESDLISIRTTNANKFIRKNNGYIGGVPYGRKKIKVNNIPVLTTNSEEMNIINLIIKQYMDDKSIDEIVTYLQTNNIKKRNCEWTQCSVKNLIEKNKNFSVSKFKNIQKGLNKLKI